MSFELSPEVRDALANGRPVVALESTLVAQGLPWPENLQTALDSESAVRASGAVPATIAVLEGKVRVGLQEHELRSLASSTGFLKISRRDLSAVVSQRKDAATTVAATLWVARQAGIRVMATGGLGGVHRDAGNTFDVSTDLDELARADGVLLVCSGVKSILDMPATLEALETRGVAVVGYRTSELPGFTTVTSGLPLDFRVDSPAEAAALLRAHRSLGLPGAVVLAQPVQADVALDRDEMEQALSRALSEAAAYGVRGKPLTPFLLDAIRTRTEGRSLRANRALIVANAALAADVASAVAP